jgi:hypothetical protein
MEVAKQDGYRQEYDVTRISAKQPSQFYHFGEAEHERDLRPE